jgi:tetratricopeptide (TPR) repeat protein
LTCDHLAAILARFLTGIAMSSPPSGDSDERGPEGATESPTEKPPTVDVEETTAKTAEWLNRASANDPAADVAFHEAEVAALLPGNPRRAATLVYEAAHLRERALGLEREGAKAYAHALTLDPSFAPNAWALRRVFARRVLWDNLVRVLDAETRFGTWPRPGDRADLQLERGRLLEDRLGREVEAVESYLAALATAPDHAGALWSLLLHGWRTGDGNQTDTALNGLLRHVPEAGGRALVALEIGRLLRRGDRAQDPEALPRAADTLFRALSMGAEPAPLLRELDRLSLLADRVDLRLRYLDAFESRVAREVLQQTSNGHSGRQDPARGAIVSHHREKARILLRRGARDAALAVLERTLRVAPSHPIVLLDFLDAADEAGRADAIVAMLDGPLADLPAEQQAEALLRRAEIAEKTGALGEASGTLERIPAASPLAPLVTLTRLRVLARLQDADGLARAFVEVAERLSGGDEVDRREAAHLLVRAATARARVTEEGEGSGNAEALLRRALALVPGYGPAAAGLAATLAHGKRFSDLVSFIEQQATAGGGMSHALRESVVTLYRDLLLDVPAALPHQRALLEETDDDRAHLRTADLCGLAGGELVPEAVRHLEWLTERSPAGPAGAGLRLLTARLLGSADRDRVESLLHKAFDADPASLAAAALEHLLGEDPRRLESVVAELRAAEQSGRHEVARALRFRLAFAHASGGRLTEALAHLEPLRRKHDALASAWSLDLARQARQPHAEAALLRESSGDSDDPGEIGASFERVWALAEALEEAGDRPAARAAFTEAATRADRAGPARAADVQLGIFRGHVAEGQAAEAADSLRRLARSLEGDAGVAVAREAALQALAAGAGAEAAPGDGAADGVWRWLRGVRAGDGREAVQGMEQMAEQAQAGPAAAALWTAVGIRKAFMGDAGTAAALERAARELSAVTGDGRSGEAALALAATDVAPRGALTNALRELRRARAQRLAHGTEAQRRLAEELLLEEGLDAETTGKLDAAASAYAATLAIRPDSLDATEGMRRLAQARGDRRLQATALARRGALSRSRRRAAEAYAEAALLLEEEGQDAEAAQLFLKVLERMPADDEAYHRLHAILTRRDDADGLDRLLSYKLHQTTDPAARVRLYLDRARLRLDGTGNRKGAIEDLRRILELDPEHAESLRRLGRLAVEDRRFAVAARFLEQALERESDEETKAALRLQLAEAHDGAGDLAGAIRVLTAATEARPDDPEARERLIALAIRKRDFEVALDQLHALESRAEDHAARAAVLLRVGRLERDVRHDAQRALTAFRSALVLDPLGEAAGELASLVPGTVVLDDQDRLAINVVIDDLRKSLADRDPLDARRLERLQQVAKLRGLGELSEVAGQLLGALGKPGERVKPRDLARPLSLGTVTALMADDDGGRVGLVAELWPILGEAAARFEGLEPAQFGAGRATRVTPGAEPRLKWLEAAALAIGIAPVVHVAAQDNISVVALDAPEPTMIVGRAVLAGDPASRFRAGRALFLLHQRAATVERLPLAQLDEILWGAAMLSGARPPGVDATALKARARALGKGMGRKEMKALEGYRARLESATPDGGAWRAAVIRGADRFGLLVAGDAGAALRVLASKGGGSLDLRRPECLELARFALDERYLVLRRDTGLAAGDR